MGHEDIEDLSLLHDLPDLQELVISKRPLIKSILFFSNEKGFGKGLAKLSVLRMDDLAIPDLHPLSSLWSLRTLYTYNIPNPTSLLPLSRSFRSLYCFESARDLDVLKERRPGLWQNDITNLYHR